MKDQRQYESELHRELGMTDEEIREEMRQEGLDPDAEADALRSTIHRAIARHKATPTWARAADPMALRLDIFREAVSAGAPTPEAGALAAKASLMELLRVGNPESLMWAPVSGWSMRDASIKDGDLVLIDRSRQPRDGDLVLAFLAGQGQMVKRLRLLGDRGAMLESANPDFAPIHVPDAAALTIHGVVVARAGKL